jgi:hypothetical protein
MDVLLSRWPEQFSVNPPSHKLLISRDGDLTTGRTIFARETNAGAARDTKQERMNKRGRIEIHGGGIGEISDADIQRRAAEIARMDGRAEPGEQDRLCAREELVQPGTPPAPEADESTTPIQSWSKGPASRGQRGVHTDLEDEVSPAEQLVNEGLEEADHDQRLSASKEQRQQPE